MNPNDFIPDLPDEGKAILNVIQKNSPIIINELIKLLHINRGRLQRLMQTLEHAGLIVSSGHTSSTGGRRSVLYDINCTDYFVAGIAIGSTRYSTFIVNLKNEPIISRQFPRDPSITLEDFIQVVCMQLKALASEASIPYSALIGAGIGIPGAVDQKQGILIRQHSDFFHSSWLNSPMRDIFEKSLHIPVVLDLNIYGETLASYYYGHGRKSEKLMVVACSTSIINGFISKGQLLRSINDREDALAHITVDINGLPCRCGNYGCIECYSSVKAIINRFVSDLKMGRTSSIEKDISQITIHDIVQAAESGDSLASNTIEYAARVLGCGLANYMRLLSPDTVILNGTMIDASPLYYNTVIATVKRQLFHEEGCPDIHFIKNDRPKTDVFSESAATLYLEHLFNPEEKLIPRITE